MESLINWITFFCSVLAAAAISLTTFFADMKKHKQDVITHAITINRIEWITNVRDLISEFLTAYVNGKSKKELDIIRMKIELYIRENADYNNLSSALKVCCKGAYSEKNANKLIEVSQIVLQRAWRRIKIEGGQSKEDDERISKLIDEYEKR